MPTTTFRDPPNGITLEYPRAWKRVEVPVAEYRLALDAGNNVAFTLRVVPIQQPATPQNLQNFKAVTDGLVASNPTVKVFKEQAISLNGMLGYYYFYTFEDGPVTAVHAHYFLFSGNKMNILVFQTLPDDFEPLAATFDRVAESFRSDPNIPPTSHRPGVNHHHRPLRRNPAVIPSNGRPRRAPRLVVAALCAGLLAGCGGSSGGAKAGDGAERRPPPPACRRRSPCPPTCPRSRRAG